MRESAIQVVYQDPGGEGYHCVLHMARLAARLFDGELIIVPASGNPTRADKLKGILLPKKTSGSACLVICPSPADLSSILLVPHWRSKFNRVAAWVFDSFWPNWIPPWAKASRLFDHVFVTERDDLDAWRGSLRAPVDWLPWGSDVLDLGSANPDRPLDLIRFGRQPSEWNDDEASARVCRASGINFHGRPPSLTDATDNERGLMAMLSQSKFTLAFSNRVNPNPQTHPTREYITGRWTDSLAAGATVAGIPPKSEGVQSLLWPEALLDLGTVNQSEGLMVIDAMVRAWTPERARLNYLKSLEALDWRWRFKTIASALGVNPLPLERELTRIADALRAAQPTANVR
jgi:hypothetical protein